MLFFWNARWTFITSTSSSSTSRMLSMRSCHRWSVAGSDGAGATFGQVKWNVAPLARRGLDPHARRRASRRSSSPPTARCRCPRPCRAPASVWKIPQMRSWYSGAMPGPVVGDGELVRVARAGASRRARATSGRAAPAYFTALPIRFRNTCCSGTRSAVDDRHPGAARRSATAGRARAARRRRARARPCPPLGLARARGRRASTPGCRR